MNIEELRHFCLEKKGVTEECPFGPQTLVFKVAGKIFALCNIDDFKSINLKCDPEKAIELRAAYFQIKPGFHMNKKHWNTVQLDELNIDFIYQLINHSYDIVVSGLPKKTQIELNSL